MPRWMPAASSSSASAPLSSARLGAEAEVDAYMQELVDTVRTRLIRAVNQRRAPNARWDDERTAWADCVRAHAAALASRPGASEALAEEALRQCASDEASVHEELIRQRGGPAADQMMPILVGALRGIAMQVIRQARAAQDDDR